MFCSFIKNGKECKDHSVLLLRTEKNAKIVPFFYKEWKIMQRSFCSFEKNGCLPSAHWAVPNPGFAVCKMERFLKKKKTTAQVLPNFFRISIYKFYSLMLLFCLAQASKNYDIN